MSVKTCSSCGNLILKPSQPCFSCGALADPETYVAPPPETETGDSSMARDADRNYQYDVFISFKNSDKDGNSTEDSVIATKIYEYLKGKGLRVFLSVRELEFLGKSQYTDVIDNALETSRFLIAVGCSRENLDSEWVRYEWSSFLNDIRSGFMQNKEVYVLYRGMKIADLPRSLRQQQAFNADEEDACERVCNFIQSAMIHYEYAHSLPTPTARPVNKAAEKSKNRIPAAAIALFLFVLLAGGWIYSMRITRTQLVVDSVPPPETETPPTVIELPVLDNVRHQASAIMTDLSRMRGALSVFYSDTTNDRSHPTSVASLLPYLEPKFSSPIYLLHLSDMTWVGVDLSAADMGEGVREILSKNAQVLGLYAEPNRNSVLYTNHDRVWMWGR